ncbi:PREDICTED: transmembrane protein 9-like isoform X2 [Priapulus caudatus]|uniref:Transmembrane protein 9-like isoform X2 n=1 Tax=Priapulus caudatus TaxID=37621 RepID=A0ABM1EPF4_PRICU|nr:PREDICTED: transmembrane protein 9-like isoform X2 [Priapulus caudatus]
MCKIYLYICCSLLILAVNLLEHVNASEEESRCKCVCPSPTIVNGTETNKTVYTVTKIPAEECKCGIVVEMVPELHASVGDKVNEFCPRCECKFESRNPTTIKVVIIIIICILSFLLIYMLFLLCLDPLMTKRGIRYSQQQNEEHDSDVRDLDIDFYGVDNNENLDEPERVCRRPRPDTVLNRVGNQKERWKSQVQEQRRNVFDRHSMLN